MRRKSRKPDRESSGDGAAVRERILREAFSVFLARGFTRASMLEIATRARVSKRDLYVLVGNKQAMLVAGIAERAARMRPPANRAAPRNRRSLARVLTGFGARVLCEATDPTVIGVFRLAIGQIERAPEVARTLHSLARECNRAALREILARARSCGLLRGETASMAEQFVGLLWGSLMVSLLLAVADPPTRSEALARARAAARDFMLIHPEPADSATRRDTHEQGRPSQRTG